MANIHDVAKAAGVSISTVSYALSGKRSIGEATRVRIADAVRELGYRPNAGARMLAGTTTHIFALSAPFRPDTYAPAHMAFVLAVTQAARAYDYDVLLLTEDEATGGLQRVAASRLVDGVIVLDVARDDERTHLLHSIDLPATVIGIPDDTEGLVCVDLDFRQAAEMSLARLTDKGHQSIGMLGHPPRIYERGSNFPHRFRAGFEDAAAERGVRGAVALPGHGPAGVRGALDELYEQLPDMTGLVMNCEEPIQTSALDELADRGIDIPGGLSVISACSSFDTSRFSPPLDVIPLVAAESCERGVELLVEQLTATVDPRVDLVAPHYIDRGSVSPLS
ncbi:LacI family DNA-binding transcriptional regulator [Microbacterium sp. MPKO10]|uniref:LacI family DNA-binding transcriptional regulator n=1 Tax=Microbacterium sp. MPKO10 TaxID=2989818 RepID=UPI0022361B4B|nr:LacI family DNA-binding transcriptional regulator [Microbacterium sp. MPKO10]MCW4458721.1 LacI family transcriptional regulator [Microbacterium sp. MPKO10]